MSVLIDTPLAQPLLDVAAGDPAPDVRVTAVETLTLLPLTPEAWRVVADRGARILRDLEQTSSLTSHTFDVLTRIPVRSMRVMLAGVARDVTREDSFACAIALARRRDPAGLQRVLTAVGEQPTELIAETIACFPIERYAVDPSPLHQAMRDGDETVRFWAALALARLGDRAALRSLLGQLPSNPPPLFYGDPWTPYNALAQTRPLPAPLRRSIVAFYKLSLARARANEGPDARLPRDVSIFVGGLTGLVDAEGQAIEPDRKAVDEPAHVEPDPEAGRKLFEALRAIAEPYIANLANHVSVTNAMLDAVLSVGGGIDLPIREALADPMIVRLPRKALTWTLARAGAAKLVEETGAIIAAAPASERREVVELTRDIAASLKAKAPYAGAGPGESPETTMAEGPIIDDLATAGSPPVAEPAPAPKPRRTTPSAATATAYPDIRVSHEHPIAGADLTIEVALAAAPVVGSSGRVGLPAGDPTAVHTLDVTVVFGTTLKRDTLKYSVAAGTTKPARFTTKVPAIAGLDRAIATVRVNFYLNKRWCGQGTRTIDIRRDDTVPPGEAPPGGSDDLPPLHFDPNDQPADLTIRICHGVGDRDFVWECTSPHVDIPLPKNPQHAVMRLDETAKDFVRKHFKTLASKPLTDVAIADIEGIGEQIYTSTPRHFKDAYWLVWNLAQGLFEFDSVQIVTDEPYVPWELMRLADEQRAPGVAAEFLGVRHSVGRWLESERARMRQRLVVTSIAVSASDYESVKNIQQKLPWAGKERDFLLDSYGARNIPLTSNDLLDFLDHGCVQAMHFACHGQMFIDDPLSSQLVCEDTPNVLKPTMVNRSEVRKGLGSQKPLVFLNACEIGSGAAALSLVAGFPAAFLDAGASAVVCPLWVVNDERAGTISESFYKQVFANPGTPIGRVMREIRAGWRDGQHLTFLAYVLYGDPLASVTYRRP